MLEVGVHHVGDDPVDVRLGHALDQRGRHDVVLLAVHAGLAVTQVARGGPHGVDLGARHVLGLELLLDEIGDRLDERRVRQQRGPVLAAEASDAGSDRQLLLGAHHAEAGHLAEVHAEEVRRLVAVARGLDLFVVVLLLAGRASRSAPRRRSSGGGPHPRTGAGEPGRRSTGYFAACHDDLEGVRARSLGRRIKES
jgi:hypothetical protein